MARMGSRIAPAAQLSSGTQHRTATGNEDGATSGLQPASSTARMGARTAPPGQDRSPAGPHVRSAALGWAREAAPEQSWLTKSRRTWTDTGAGPGQFREPARSPFAMEAHQPGVRCNPPSRPRARNLSPSCETLAWRRSSPSGKDFGEVSWVELSDADPPDRVLVEPHPRPLAGPTLLSWKGRAGGARAVWAESAWFPARRAG